MMPPGDDDLALPAERRSSDAITRAAACGRLRSIAASALRHRFADIRDARKRPATDRPVTPASINSATAGRTCSRQACPGAVSPPPSGSSHASGTAHCAPG